jgi:protein phosphatase
MANKSSIEEFLQLTENVTQILAGENGSLENLQTIGNLAVVSPVGKVVIVGDLHGDLNSLMHILNDSNFLANMRNHDDVKLIFLGDYGDRGSCSPEVYFVVLKLKELFTDRVILMRGNHEGPYDLLAFPHDLPIQINQKFGERGPEAYVKLRRLFNHLYTAVLIKERYILLHGGVPSQANDINDIAYAHEKHPREPHLEEILWSDPWEGIKGTIGSPRGAGRLFGEDVTRKFLGMLEIKVLLRGHESSEEGYKTNHNGKVLTLFSRRGPPYHNNSGAYLILDISRKAEKPLQLLQRIRKF